MGATKQLLPWPRTDSDKTVVETSFDLLTPHCGKIIVVVGCDSGAIVEALSSRRFETVRSDPDAEMFDSIRAGLRAAQKQYDAAHVMLHPADHVQVLPSTIDKLVSAFRTAQDRQPRAVVGTNNDRGGHPVLIPNAMIDSILRWSGSGGLRQYLRDNPDNCLRIPYEDAGLVHDLDTPADYERGVDKR